MHELSLCRGLLTQVERIARHHGATAADRIELVIGPLAGVEVTLLERAFVVACQGTAAENAELVVEHASIVVACNICGETTAASANNLTCQSCGAWQITLKSGEELLLKSVVLSGLPDAEYISTAAMT